MLVIFIITPRIRPFPCIPLSLSNISMEKLLCADLTSKAICSIAAEAGLPRLDAAAAVMWCCMWTITLDGDLAESHGLKAG